MVDTDRESNFTTLAGFAIGAVILLSLATADYFANTSFNASVAYPTVLLICAWVRRRSLLWSLTILAAVLGVTVHLMEHGDSRGLLHRMLALGTLLVTAAVFHWLLGALEARARQADELRQNNAEIAAREQEIATQNEELRSQTEELERQSEELRVANEELARRERTLEALLRLSRSLNAEMARSETLDRICQALGEMINGPGLGVGVKLLDGGRLHLICHFGFGPEGPDRNDFVFEGSFARLVIEKNHTGYLEDISLRPDVSIPQPKEGEPFRSVLAAPLRISGEAIGVLEVYSRDRRTWSDEQMAMVESLAAQTSISLQADELFTAVDQERERLSAVLKTIPIGIAIANASCTEISLNPAGANLLGVPLDQKISGAMLLRRVQLVRLGAEVAAERRPLQRACRGEVVTAEEYDVAYTDGRRTSLMVNAAPIHDNQERIIGAVGAYIDVSKQKQLQQELDARRRTAEEASTRKSRFLAQVSHDIRNPVNAISLLAELLYRTASEDKMAAEVPGIAADLRKNAVSLVNLISDVLDLTRFDSGRIDLEETEFSLNALLLDECRTYQSMAADKGIELQCFPPPEPLTIRADRVKLSRVLGNLLSNALKFTEHGKVTISAGCSLGEGNGDSDGSRMSLPAPLVWICVRDTGPGISDEFHQRIFDEFFQLRNNQTHRGTGLGLAICKRLVEAMGGSIRVESKPGDGSSFTVEIPQMDLVGA
jgi:PAS domain S-box-containing protein